MFKVCRTFTITNLVLRLCPWNWMVTDQKSQATMHYLLHMWHYCVEIEGYSIAYFDCIAVFEPPYRLTSRAHMHFVDNYASMKHIRALNRSAAIRRFKHSNAIEMHDGITCHIYIHVT